MSTKAATKPSTPAEQEQLAALQTIEVEPKPATRAELLNRIKDAGYTGPTSFTATVLRDVAAWMEAGSPKDGNVPKSVLLAVHPDLRLAAQPKARRLTAQQRGFQEALSAVAAFGDDLQAIRRWVADNTAKDEA